MKRIIRIACAAALVGSSAAGAAGQAPRGEFDLMGNGLRTLLSEATQSCLLRGPADAGIDLAPIVNVGRDRWKVVEDNKALPSSGRRFAAAVPESLGDWRRLCQWSPPESDEFGFQVPDLLGGAAVDATYAIVRTAGGRYGGKGRFLTGVSVMPVRIEVKAGYKLSMEAEVLAVNNIGAPQDPIAAIALAVRWRVTSLTADRQGAAVYYVRGDGAFMEIPTR